MQVWCVVQYPLKHEVENQLFSYSLRCAMHCLCMKNSTWLPVRQNLFCPFWLSCKGRERSYVRESTTTLPYQVQNSRIQLSCHLQPKEFLQVFYFLCYLTIIFPSERLSIFLKAIVIFQVLLREKERGGETQTINISG